MKRFLIFSGVIAIGVLAALSWSQRAPETVYVPIEWAANPGALSKAHAFLEDDCSACHTPNKGVEAANCITCHANNKELLALPATAFHANVSMCAPCHVEHQGANHRPKAMDHEALAKSGLRELALAENGTDAKRAHAQLAAWIRRHAADDPADEQHPRVSRLEATLDCNSCHANVGQRQTMHAERMGENCASCHSTKQWTIPTFVHPSPRSTDCVQCHREPPSHRMMHFEMVSQKVAKVEAPVDQCYKCHQPDAWNNIKGVGWYKMH